MFRVATMPCMPEIRFHWTRARYSMLMRVYNDVILGLTTPDCGICQQQCQLTSTLPKHCIFFFMNFNINSNGMEDFH